MVSDWWQQVYPWLAARGPLLAPLLLTLWMAWGDIRTHRIPNYLTFGTALTGLGYQLWAGGWGGLWDGFLGLLLGFFLLILPYALGGMGAGDVKALAGLGAWLGVKQTFILFILMGVAGGVLAILVVCWRGQVREKLKAWKVMVMNFMLIHAGGGKRTAPAAAETPRPQEKGFAYGVALALGMVALFVRG
ncbi:MAG: prepilin peptidase [Deltaproteobacteria bacterium]|nr:prepilin peptidase [Deltaproteobacteria bacterium]